MSYGGDYDDDARAGIPSQTRTRLPEDPALPSRRPPASPRRSLMTIVGVVVLLIAAIVMANRADDRGGSSDNATDTPDGQAQPTAPTGEQPVDGSTNGIPSGFARTEQGAQSAAANYAVALGGEGMFNPEQRRRIVETLSAASSREGLQEEFGADYSAAFNERIGLSPEGFAPGDQVFVSRAVPIGTSVHEYDAGSAEVSVWCSGLFGIAGSDSTTPVRNSWFTVHFTLVWEDEDWKVLSTDQTEGPAPVGSDTRVSSADEIAEAVELYGGFTYAR